MHADRLFSVLEDAGNRIADKISGLSHDSASQILKVGADGTPTRRIDHECEEIFISVMKENDVPYSIMSEEAGFVGDQGGPVMLVDPIDGTTNALNGLPYYSLSVGLVEKDLRSATAAFVMNLSDHTVYTALKGEGAYRNGKEIHTGRRSGIYIINYGRKTDPYLERIISRAFKYRKFGSTALDLCLLAQGSADAVFSIGPGSSPRNFDVAAGILIAEEAGGYVSDIEGNPYNLGLDPSAKKDMIGVAEKAMVVEFI